MNDRTAESAPLSLVDRIAAGMGAVHGRVGLHLRGQHPKGHAVLQATVQVLEVPAGLGVGVFAAPVTYSAYVRFSNGIQADDRLPDARGLAIRMLLPGTPAREQHFVLASSPIFFAKNAADFARFLALKQQHSRQLTRALLDLSDPLSARPVADAGAVKRQVQQQQFRELCGPDHFPAMQGFVGQPTQSLLSCEWHSQTPYRLGTAVVKYVLQPDASNADAGSWSAGASQYRDAISAFFSAGRTAVYTLGVIVQTNESEMPIEDATVRWSGPIIPVARLTIAPQDFLSPAVLQAGERMQFSPSTTLPEHIPVGSLNEARAVAYAQSARVRHANAQTIRRYFGCLAAGDYAGMIACLAEGVEFRDLGFQLSGRDAVGLMWHMLCLREGGIRVSVRNVAADDVEGTAQWECQYEFQADADSPKRSVHNRISSHFRFDPVSGLIAEHRDECDFWAWFEQAMGAKGTALRMLDGLEDAVVPLVNVEERLRKRVRESAMGKLRAVLEGD